MNLRLALTLALLGTRPLLFAQSPESKPTQKSTRELIDACSEADLAKILPLLRENYVAADQVSETEIARATLEGLLLRLNHGVILLPAPPAPTEPPNPFLFQILEPNVAYLRLGSLNPENLSHLDSALQNLEEKRLSSVVLDLRATPAAHQYELAAETCKRFTQKAKLLFRIQKPSTQEERLVTSKEDPRFRGLLVVLVSQETAGAAEVIAGVLHLEAKAMLIGQTTQGGGAEFVDLSLPSGKVLRVATARVVLSDQSVLFPSGLKPDLIVEVPTETTAAVLKGALEKDVKSVLVEPERAQLNEAALVAGTNPELEAYQANQKNRGQKPKPLLQDLVLQRALDFITVLRTYEKKDGSAKTPR